MKLIICHTVCVILMSSLMAQIPRKILLNPPDTSRGLPVMKALSLRSSVTEWDTKNLDTQDLSDLLWAANGINRPQTGKRTAPSALNAQDIDIYVFMRSGVYIYNAMKHQLEWVADGDLRTYVAGSQENAARAPVIFLLVSDISKFNAGEDSLKFVWAAMDAAIVSQNISIFCASAGFATRPRVTMDQQKLRELLDLKESQHLMLNNPVSY